MSEADAGRQENYADLPIDDPSQDLYGTNPFVQSLAKSIQKMKSPQGIVIALNGPWGSGKSSAINLLRHHLKPSLDKGEIEIATFNPWWFRGEEALVLAFFRELYAATKPSLGEKAKKSLSKLGARLMKAGSVVAPVADALGATGAGTITSGAMAWLSDMIEDGESVEDLHKELSGALSKQDKRYVVIIDDIDRLAPDEALAMFRLVKSVGRLPNVIYLLAFDRILAERVVAERFPSEGAHYLEKIVQASFELPMPLEVDLHAQLKHIIFSIAPPSDEEIVHVMNHFHEALAPVIRTPRDVVRYANAFGVTWPAVEGDVDLGDFLALEALRLFQPGIYKAIRENGPLICGSGSSHLRDDLKSDQLDALLLSTVVDKDHYRDVLTRLFPKLESIWKNMIHSDGDWSKRRRVCSADHFPTYFRLGPTDDIATRAEIDALFEAADDPGAAKMMFRTAATQLRRNGGSKAATLLGALSTHGASLNLAKAEPLLTGLFEIADELAWPADKALGFLPVDNELRIHWALRAILFDRTSLKERSAILKAAMKNAGLAWLGSFAVSAWRDYNPRKGKSAQVPEKCLMTQADAKAIERRLVRSIRAAAKDGTLLENHDLGALLFMWRDFGADSGKAMRAWVKRQMADDHGLARLASAFTHESWGQSSGDLVAKRSDTASVSSLEAVLDATRFRTRLETVEKEGHAPALDLEAVTRLLAAWRREGQSDPWD